MSSVRAFFALDPDPAAVDFLHAQIARVRMQPWAQHVRWVDDAAFHITTRFLGEIDEGQLRGAIDLLDLGAASKLQIELGSARFFPNPKHPRVVACMIARNPALKALAAACETLAQAIGLTAERRDFTPHITLGRIKDAFPADAVLPQADLSHAFHCDKLTLYKSELTASGAQYSVLHTFPLRA